MTTAESLPITLRLGPVHLNITDLDRSVAWYQRSLGLRLREQGDGWAALGDSVASSIVLHEVTDARPTRDDEAGLFHYCLLYRTRQELARAHLRLEGTETDVTHMNDRHTHEAIYLDDPDGNHIELAWDRPREQWPDEPYGRTPVELNLPGLLATVAGETPPASVGDGLQVGHVHFIVGDVEESVRFYCDVLGLDLKYHVGEGAFFSVGGYHHHAAARIARGRNVKPQPPNAIGMRYWTIELADADEVEAARVRIEAVGQSVQPLENGFAVSDPWNIPAHIVS